MTRRETFTGAATIAVPLVWLVMLETGLLHRTDMGVVVLSVVIVLSSVSVAWWWMRWWAKQ